MQGNHKKHGKDIKARFGRYGRNEIAFIGAPCSIIQSLTTEIAGLLSNNLALAYLDADHAETPDIDGFMQNGALQSSTRKKNFYQHLTEEESNQLNPKLALTSADLVLINGNHFESDCQLVILDTRKTDSLRRNVHKLINILAFIDLDGNQHIPDFIKASTSYSEEIPMLSFANKKEISNLVQTWMKSKLPKLNGLVLSGGLSTRMGRDKGEIVYHKIPHREYVAHLLSEYCDNVFISTNGIQEVKSDFKILPDVFLDMGPLGAILTAFKSQPDTAWLVLACDMPFVDKDSIEKLIEERNTKFASTAYKRSDAEFPEPLFAIYEPKIYARALQMLSLGIQCPRKLLINSRVKIIQPQNDQVLMNANYPNEKEEAFNLLNDGGK